MAIATFGIKLVSTAAGRVENYTVDVEVPNSFTWDSDLTEGDVLSTVLDKFAGTYDLGPYNDNVTDTPLLALEPGDFSSDMSVPEYDFSGDFYDLRDQFDEEYPADPGTTESDAA